MDEKVCQEIHKSINDKLNKIDRRLDGHSKKIDVLELAKAEDKNELKNLCKSLDTLNGRLDVIVKQNSNMQKIFISALVAFFFFVIEKQMFP